MRLLLAACLLASFAPAVRAEEEPPAAITDPAVLGQLDEAFPPEEEGGTPGRDRPFEVPEDQPLSAAEIARLAELGVTVDENGRLVYNNQELTNAMAFHYLGAAGQRLISGLRERYGGNLAWARLTPVEQAELTNVFWNRLYLLPETDQTLVRTLLRGRLTTLPTGNRPFGARLTDVGAVVNPNSPYLAGPGSTAPQGQPQQPPSPQPQAGQPGANQQQGQGGGGLFGCNRGGGASNQEEQPQEAPQEAPQAAAGGPGLWLFAILLARARGRRRG